MPGRPAFLVFYLSATLAAFGGIYDWAIPPIVIGAVLLTALPVPRATSLTPDTQSLDWAIVALVAAIAIQLVPLPAPVRSALSPHLAAAEVAIRPDSVLRVARAGTLSIDPAATGHALALVFAAALTYRAARASFRFGGVRFVCGALGVVGVIFAIAAIAQRALAPTLIYGFWQPRDVGAEPFGPVVNRNHFAGWLLMVSALTAGYLAVRVSRRAPGHRHRRWSRRALIEMARSTVAWTATSWIIVSATVLAAQSRSAVVGLAVALTMLLRSLVRTWRPVLVATALAVLIGVALLIAGETTATRLVDRFLGTLDSRDVSRTMIWRETLPMIADFPVAGVGAGAFGHAMLAYQQTRAFASHLGTEWYFNHAHNHYLQLAAEGGVLLTAPVLVIGVLFVRLVMRRVRDDTSEMRTIRLGAVAGLIGAATQSLWEVPLTMPAAALLAATLAAVATYQRDPSELSK